MDLHQSELDLILKSKFIRCLNIRAYCGFENIDFLGVFHYLNTNCIIVKVLLYLAENPTFHKEKVILSDVMHHYQMKEVIQNLRISLCLVLQIDSHVPFDFERSFAHNL